MTAISLLAFFRIVLPFPFSYAHDFRNRGPLRHIFITLNSVWDKDDLFLNFISFRRILFVIWLIGAIIGIVRLIKGYNRTMKYISFLGKRINNEVEDWPYIPEKDKKLINKRKISVFKIAGIDSPATCGVFRPMVLIPDNKRFGKNELKVIISHELAHIRRGDLIKKFLIVTLNIIYWWFPPFKRLSEISGLVMEMQTDKRASECEINDYLEGFVATSEAMNDMQDKKDDLELNLPHCHPVSLYSDDSEMRKRIKKLALQSRENPVVSIGILLLSLTIFASSYLFSIKFDYTYDEQAMIDESEGYVTPNEFNAKIIKKDDGTYEEYIFMNDYGFILGGKYNSLCECSSGIPIYNEKGEKLKWPFFHR